MTTDLRYRVAFLLPPPHNTELQLETNNPELNKVIVNQRNTFRFVYEHATTEYYFVINGVVLPRVKLIASSGSTTNGEFNGLQPTAYYLNRAAHINGTPPGHVEYFKWWNYDGREGEEINKDLKAPLSLAINKVEKSDYLNDDFGAGGSDYNDYWINKARYLSLNVGPIASATWIQQNYNGIRGVSPYNPASFHSTLGRTLTSRYNITSYSILHYEHAVAVGKAHRHNESPHLRWIQIQFFFADALGGDVTTLGDGNDKQNTRPNDYSVQIVEVLPTGVAPTNDGSNPNNLNYVAQNADGSVAVPMWSAFQNGINNVNRYNNRMFQNQTARIVNYISHSKTAESFVLSICYDDDTYLQDQGAYPGNNGVDQPNMEFGFNILVFPM